MTPPKQQLTTTWAEETAKFSCRERVHEHPIHNVHLVLWCSFVSPYLGCAHQLVRGLYMFMHVYISYKPYKPSITHNWVILFLLAAHWIWGWWSPCQVQGVDSGWYLDLVKTWLDSMLELMGGSINDDTPIAGWFILEIPARNGCFGDSPISGNLHI